MADIKNELRAGRVGCRDIRRITPEGAEGDWQWRVTLRCEENVIVPFAVIDGTHGEVLFDLDDATVSCEAVVFEGKRVCPKYADCVVCVDTSS